ncbi:hypothetical protein SEA_STORMBREAKER8_61 [Microbacterium phage Stormbreaker8]|nr:hypothetical protein SEA_STORMBREAKER8_61 [Microbacterium phage Stormbreaker8]
MARRWLGGNIAVAHVAVVRYTCPMPNSQPQRGVCTQLIHSGVTFHSMLLDLYIPVSLTTPWGEVFVWSEGDMKYLSERNPMRQLSLESGVVSILRPDAHWEISDSS